MPCSGSMTGFEFSEELQVLSHTSQPTGAQTWVLHLQLAHLGVSQQIASMLHFMCSGVITAEINPNAAITCVFEQNSMQRNSWLLLPPVQGSIPLYLQPQAPVLQERQRRQRQPRAVCPILDLWHLLAHCHRNSLLAGYPAQPNLPRSHVSRGKAGALPGEAEGLSVQLQDFFICSS